VPPFAFPNRLFFSAGRGKPTPFGWFFSLPAVPVSFADIAFLHQWVELDDLAELLSGGRSVGDLSFLYQYPVIVYSSLTYPLSEFFFFMAPRSALDRLVFFQALPPSY